MIDQTPNFPGERWLPVVGSEGKYSVSSLGRVRSESRTIVTKRGIRKPFVGRVLAQALSGSGYPFVALGQGRPRSVHRLVMLAFEPRADAASLEVNHKSGVKTDNRRSNLEWVTRSENKIHAVHVLGYPTPFIPSGAENWNAFAVERVSADGAVVRYDAASLAILDGCTSSGISSCLHGRQRTHRGCTWRVAKTGGGETA